MEHPSTPNLRDITALENLANVIHAAPSTLDPSETGDAVPLK
jgi:hypothetical protein